MGEIKSTMDLILERAKEFSVTEEEKQAIKERDFENKVKSLINRFIEGARANESIILELKELNEKRSIIHLLLKFGEEKINLESDNSSLLQLIKEFRPDISDKVEEKLMDYNKKIHERGKVREQELIKELEEDGISGSAVRINLNGDSRWKSTLLEIENEFSKEIQEIINGA